MRPPLFHSALFRPCLLAVAAILAAPVPVSAQSQGEFEAWQARRDFERLNRQQTDRFLDETEARRRALDAARNRALGPAPTPPAFRPQAGEINPPPPPRRGERVVPKPPRAMPPRAKPAPPPEDPGSETTGESGG